MAHRTIYLLGVLFKLQCARAATTAIVLMGSCVVTFATDYNFEYAYTCHVSSGVNGFNGFRLESQSAYHIVDSYFDVNANSTGWPQQPAPTFNSATNGLDQDFFNANSLFLFHSGDLVHVGVSYAEKSTIQPYGYFLRVQTEVPDCMPLLVNFSMHTESGTMSFTDANSVPVTVESDQAEYYEEHQPLASLNAHSPRKPLSTVALDLPTTLAPGQEVFAHLRPPSGAKFVVVALAARVGDQEHIWRMWAQYPTELFRHEDSRDACGPRVMIPWLLVLLLLGLLVVGWWRHRRRGSLVGTAA